MSFEPLKLTRSGYEKCDPDKETIKCIFTCNCIHFVLDGAGYFNGNKLEKGNAFFIPKNHLCTYFPEPENPWTYAYINFTDDMPTDIIEEIVRNNNTFEYQFKMIKEILPCFTTEEGAEKFAFTFKDKMLFTGLIYSFIGNLVILKENETTHRKITLAKRYINQKFADGITIAEVAEYLNISVGHLRHIFQQNEHVSPQQYLVSVKMNHALLFLQKGYNITETAMSVGYSDPFQFSKYFKKYYGLSPKKYLKRMEETNKEAIE